jgi:topoisomerase-4 subunit A
VTKYPVRKISHVSTGKSSLGALKVWMDEVSGRLNQEERGVYLGAFDTGNQILAIYNDGSYEINDLDLNKKYEAAKIMYIHKFDPQLPISALYHEGEKKWTMVKRFLVETSTNDTKFTFITEASGSKLYYASQSASPKIKFSFKRGGSKVEEELDLAEFIDVKGWKALGNKLGEFKILKVTPIEESQPPKETSGVDEKAEVEEETPTESTKEKEVSDSVKEDKPSQNGKKDDDDDDKFTPGQTIELDL